MTGTLPRRALGALVRRAKQNQLLRRLLIPVLLRFPAIVLVARGVRARLTPRADILLPVWPTPLPAAYLDLPLSSRQVLLDLAGAIESPPPPPRS